jgi:hypothetical protein
MLGVISKAGKGKQAKSGGASGGGGATAVGVWGFQGVCVSNEDPLMEY